MKKFITIAFLIASLYKTSFACDVCGCSSGNYFLGLNPQFNKYFFGLRYSFRSFNTVLKNDNTQFSKDFYQTTELWGGLNISPKWQLLTFIPYNINHTESDDGNSTNKGFGDMTIIGNYKLFDKLTLNRDTQTVSQNLWIGAGIKLPSGKFSVNPNEIVSSANSQAGTGTVDFIINAAYYLIIEKWGLSSNLNYKINQSASGFKFGSHVTASAFAFRSFLLSKTSLKPNIGFLYENLNQNEFNNEKIAQTGGNDLLAVTGLETRFNKISVGCNVQLPVLQNISDDQTKIKLRGMLHITYAF